jgi:toxin HigB-1
MAYISDVIKSFRNKGLRRFAEMGDASRLSVQSAARLRRILGLLDAAQTPEDMNVPGYYFHGLTGAQRGRYSVRVTANWRLTFSFDGQDAIDLDLEDYH